MCRVPLTGEIAPLYAVRARRDYATLLLPEMVRIRRHFFNSTRAYNDRMRIYLYSVAPVSLVVTGDGVGWRAKYIDQVERSRTRKRALIAMLSSVASVKLEPPTDSTPSGRPRTQPARTPNVEEEDWLEPGDA